MKFKEGKILDKMNGNGKEVIIRFPKKNDVKEFLKLINSLVSEKAKIMVQKKYTIKLEKEWMKEVIGKSKKNKVVYLCAECDGKVVSGMSLEVGHGAKQRTAKFGVVILKKYRGKGIGKRMFGIIENLAKKSGLKIIESSFYSNNKESENFHRKMRL